VVEAAPYIIQPRGFALPRVAASAVADVAGCIGFVETKAGALCESQRWGETDRDRIYSVDFSGVYA